MKIRHLVFALVLVSACKKGTIASEVWPVGLELGTTCTYSAPETVAKLGAGGKGGNLIGEGTLVETCGGTERKIEVVKPTALEIVGPDSVKVGETSAGGKTYSLRVLGDKMINGTRMLTGYSTSGSRPAWWLDKNCGDTQITVPPTADGLTNPSIDRFITAMGAGPCTIQVQLFALTASRTITITIK